MYFECFSSVVMACAFILDCIIVNIFKPLFTPSFTLPSYQAVSMLTGLRGLRTLRVLRMLKALRALRLLRVMVRVERLYTVFTVSNTLTNSISP